MDEYGFEEDIIEKNVNMDLMTDDELHVKLEKGYDDTKKGHLLYKRKISLIRKNNKSTEIFF